MTMHNFLNFEQQRILDNLYDFERQQILLDLSLDDLARPEEALSLLQAKDFPPFVLRIKLDRLGHPNRWIDVDVTMIKLEYQHTRDHKVDGVLGFIGNRVVAWNFVEADGSPRPLPLDALRSMDIRITVSLHGIDLSQI